MITFFFLPLFDEESGGSFLFFKIIFKETLKRCNVWLSLIIAASNRSHTSRHFNCSQRLNIKSINAGIQMRQERNLPRLITPHLTCSS